MKLLVQVNRFNAILLSPHFILSWASTKTAHVQTNITIVVLFFSAAFLYQHSPKHFQILS